MQRFGDLVRRRREQLDLTREQLARAANCSPETIKKIETSQRRPSLEMAQALARGLQIPEAESSDFLKLARQKESSAPIPPRGNLPWSLTPFLGRHAEQQQINRLLQRRDVRLLTLVGAPGVGKTRLALEVARDLARHYRDGVWWISLASLADVDLMPTAVAATLGVAIHYAEDPVEQLCRHLQSRHMLLVLDNFEHLLEARTLSELNQTRASMTTRSPQQAAKFEPSSQSIISQLLQSCGSLKILITSRVALEIYGEHEHTVLPFDTPPETAWRDPDALHGYTAVRLFTSRVQAFQADFMLEDTTAPAVGELCARLDGIALAIELAAACLRQFTPQQLLDEFRLNHGRRLALLSGRTRDIPPRQQTLYNAIAYSYSMLTADEQRLFDQLGVFQGPFDENAAWAVAESSPTTTGPSPAFLHALESLARHHLLQRIAPDAAAKSPESPAGQYAPCYVLLDTLREFAQMRLEARQKDRNTTPHAQSVTTYTARDDVADVYRRHALYHAQLARTVDPIAAAGDMRAWRAMIRARHADFQAALRWALATAHSDPWPAHQLAAGLCHFWYIEAYWKEGVHWLRTVLEIPEPVQHARLAELLALRARTATGLGVLWVGIGDYPAAARAFAQALNLAQRAQDDNAAGWTYSQMAHMAELQGDYAASVCYAEKSLTLYRALNMQPYIGLALERLAVAAVETGDYEPGLRHIEEGLTLFHQLQHRNGLLTLQNMRGMVHLAQGQFQAALQVFTAAYDGFRAAEQTQGVAWSLRNLALANVCMGRPILAARQLLQSVTLYRQLGSQDALLMLVEAFAAAAARTGRLREAHLLMATAQAQRAAMSIPLSVNCRQVYARAFPPTSGLTGAAPSAPPRLSLDDAIQLAQTIFENDVLSDGMT